MNATTDKQRRHPRTPTRCTVLLSLVDGENGQQLTRTHNLSLGGCLLTSRRVLGIGTSLDLLIALMRNTIRVRGRVVHERSSDDSGRYHVGVEFTAMNPTDQAILAAILATVDSQDQIH